MLRNSGPNSFSIKSIGYNSGENLAWKCQNRISMRSKYLVLLKIPDFLETKHKKLSYLFMGKSHLLQLKADVEHYSMMRKEYFQSP